MKATNTSQTIRFLLDEAFQASSPAITKQLRIVVEKCPTLRSRFSGAKLYGNELNEQEEGTVPGMGDGGAVRKASTFRIPYWKMSERVDRSR